MNTDIKKLSKIAVSIDVEYENTNPKHKKKLRRLLKRALMIEKRLKIALGQVFPLLNAKEITDSLRNQLAWVSERMQRRHGRRIRL